MNGYVYISDQIGSAHALFAGATKAGKLGAPDHGPDRAFRHARHTAHSPSRPTAPCLWRWAATTCFGNISPAPKIFQIKTASWVEYASGIRNPVGIAFRPGTCDLFVATNERDGLGDKTCRRTFSPM